MSGRRASGLMRVRRLAALVLGGTLAVAGWVGVSSADPRMSDSRDVSTANIGGSAGFPIGSWDPTNRIRSDMVVSRHLRMPKNCKNVKRKHHGKTSKTVVCTPPPLKSPTGIAIGKSGNVWVMDSGHGHLLKLTPQGGLLGQWGSPGSGPGQFMGAAFLALDSSGAVYVADSVNDRIDKFSSHGAYLGATGGGGQGNVQFAHPTGVAVGSDGVLFVGDTYNNRIQRLPTGGSSAGGNWGSSVSLHHPSGLAVSRDGTVFVADSRNQRVVAISPGGQMITSWGSERGLAKPDGIAVDSSGHVYVTDRSVNKVFEFTSAGSPVKTWGGPGGSRGQFHFVDRGYLNGIAVDAQGDVWVADTGNNRVQELAPSGKVLAVWT